LKRTRVSYSDSLDTGNDSGPLSKLPEPEPEPKKLKTYLKTSLLADSVTYSTEPLPFGLTLELDGTVRRSDGSVWTRNVASLSADGEKVYKNYKKRVDTPSSVGQSSNGPIADTLTSMEHSTNSDIANTGGPSAMAPPIDSVPDATTRNALTAKVAAVEKELAAFNEEKNALDAEHTRTEVKYERIQGQIAALMEERDGMERSMTENRGKVDVVNKNIIGAEASKKLLEKTRSLF
jgi:hypothetical protein